MLIRTVLHTTTEKSMIKGIPRIHLRSNVVTDKLRRRFVTMLI
jgi:hypothetical protein